MKQSKNEDFYNVSEEERGEKTQIEKDVIALAEKHGLEQFLYAGLVKKSKQDPEGGFVMGGKGTELFNSYVAKIILERCPPVIAMATIGAIVAKIDFPDTDPAPGFAGWNNGDATA